MNFTQFQEQFKDFIVFSLTDIRKIKPDFDRRRLSEWQKQGYITKIRRGYYIFANQKLQEEILFLIANTIYQPSYVSFETALSFYNFIPEGVYAVTSATSRERSSFDSPVGRFAYRSLHPRIMVGYVLRSVGTRSYQIASPEKAILDYLYAHPDIKEADDFDGMRFYTRGMQEAITVKIFEKYRDAFDSAALARRANALLDYIHHD